MERGARSEERGARSEERGRLGINYESLLNVALRSEFWPISCVHLFLFYFEATR